MHTTLDRNAGPSAQSQPSDESSGSVGYTTENTLWRAATVALDTDGPILGINDVPVGALGGDQARYQVREVLGVGGMGEVRLCHDAIIGRDVALKTLLKERDMHPRARKRFFREARVQGQLEHPSILPLYDMGQAEDGELFFTMRRVRGHSLVEIVDGLAENDPTFTERYSRRKLLTAFAQVCLAVDYAHSRGVIHRDLKPSNIMLGDFGEVYVLDWGVAKIQSDGSKQPIDLPRAERSSTGNVVGTPGYMSPEQVMGLEELQDARADVYALGVLLFEILTLRPLHQGATTKELFDATLKKEHARPSMICADVPPELDAVCVMATWTNRESRLSSARALAEAVERYLDGDRDLERRRELSTDRAKSAKLLFDRLDERAAEEQNTVRAAAMRQVVESLAFDPENVDARQMLMRMFVEAPKQTPPEVEDALDQHDHRNMQDFAKWGIVVLLSWVVCTPIFTLFGVTSWWPMAALMTLTVSSAALLIWMYKTGSFSRPIINLLAVLLFAVIATSSAWMGPFVAAPQFILGGAMWIGFSTLRRVNYMQISLIGAVACALPFLLEFAHIVPPSYTITRNAITLHPRIIEYPEWPTQALLFYVSVSSVLFPGLFFRSTRGALVDAQRKLFLHAWHLKQLVPSSSATDPPANK